MDSITTAESYLATITNEIIEPSKINLNRSNIGMIVRVARNVWDLAIYNVIPIYGSDRSFQQAVGPYISNFITARNAKHTWYPHRELITPKVLLAAGKSLGYDLCIARSTYDSVDLVRGLSSTELLGANSRIKVSDFSHKAVLPEHAIKLVDIGSVYCNMVTNGMLIYDNGTKYCKFPTALFRYQPPFLIGAHVVSYRYRRDPNQIIGLEWVD